MVVEALHEAPWAARSETINVALPSPRPQARAERKKVLAAPKYSNAPDAPLPPALPLHGR